MPDIATVIAGFPSQPARGAGLAAPVNIPFRRIISCGMGGSSVAGEMLSLVRDDVVVHWDYDLPATTGLSDLVVCTSWSGNTAETLSSYDTARKLGAPIIAITTGGALAQRAAADGVPVTLIPNPDGLAPRLGAGLMAGALFGMLGMADTLPVVDGFAAVAAGTKLGQAIGDRTPVFYASHGYRKIAGWFKAMVNENAKRHAWASNFPSAAHNEVEGWQGPYQATMVPVLVGPTGPDAQALLAILKPMGYTVLDVALPGDTLLTQALTGYTMALQSALIIAEHLGVDPLETHWIDEFKKLKSRTP